MSLKCRGEGAVGVQNCRANLGPAGAGFRTGADITGGLHVTESSAANHVDYRAALSLDDSHTGRKVPTLQCRYGPCWGAKAC